MRKTHLSRCPITGQAGVCPSATAAVPGKQSSVASEDSAVSPRDQQEILWQSLLERNGHVVPTSTKLNSDRTSTNSSIIGKSSSNCTASSPSYQCPELMPANSSFLSLSSQSNEGDSGSDSDSVCGEPQTGANATACPGREEATEQTARVWPTYDQVSAHVLVTDYHESLTSNVDQHPASSPTTKYLCPHGVVCQAKLEFFAPPPTTTLNQKRNINHYTGLLTPGTTVEHCLLRLSSALRPVDHGGGAWAKALARRTFGAKLSASQILPAAALKCFRQDHASGNILLMGSKVGQPSRNFFEHALCTAVTEKIPALGLPFLRRFSRYSKYPLSLGLSEVCQYDAAGRAVDARDHTFPFALCLQPVINWPSMALNADRSRDSNDQTFDTFIDDLPRYVPVGTHLYDIYAAPTPESVSDSSQLQRIGKVISTSAFVYSSPTDGLTFRHQTKEDDLKIEPMWEERMHSHIIHNTSDGTRGSVAKMTGWQIMEEHITQRGDYVDFEQETEDPSNSACTGKCFGSITLVDPTTVKVPGWEFCGFRKAHVALASPL